MPTSKKQTKKKNLNKKKITKKKTTNESKKTLSLKKSSFFVVLLIIVIVSVFLIIRTPNEQEEQDYTFYNGYLFEEHPQIKEFWVTYVKIGEGEQRFEARYHPLDLEELYFNPDINQYFFLTQMAEGDVSISFSADVLKKESGYISLAGYELGRVLRSFFNYDIVVGVMEEFEGLEDYPVITCEDASIDNLVVEFIHGETGVEFSPFCVNIYFDEPEDSLKLSYLLIYNLLGVME